MDQKIICIYLLIYLHVYYLCMYTSQLSKKSYQHGDTWEELKDRFLGMTRGMEEGRQSVVIPFQLKSY